MVTSSEFIYCILLFLPFIILLIPKFQKCAKGLRCKLAQFCSIYAGRLQNKKKIKIKISFSVINRTNLDFIPGLTSTVLSELATTLTKTSPASGWFCRRKNLFTLSSKWFPKRVVCSPRNEEGQHDNRNINTGEIAVKFRVLPCL